MIAVVIGSAGLVGTSLMRQLMEDPEISQVISISRRSLSSANSKLKEVIISDFSQLPNEAEELKGDVYFCCLGTTIKDAGSKANFEKIDYEATIEFAKIARSHNAKCFSLISASGANLRSPFFYSRVKAKVEEELKQMKFNRLVIIRPSLLVGNRKAFRLGEWISIRVVRAISPILPAAVQRRLMTSVEVLASKLKIEGKKYNSGILVFEAKDIGKVLA